MTLPASLVPPRPTSRLRRFLRHSWLGRLPLGWWQRWLHAPKPPDMGPPPRPTVQLVLEGLEDRKVFNDIFGLLQVPIAVAGAAVVAGNLLTPQGAMAHGFAYGQPSLAPPPPGDNPAPGGCVGDLLPTATDSDAAGDLGAEAWRQELASTIDAIGGDGAEGRALAGAAGPDADEGLPVRVASAGNNLFADPLGSPLDSDPLGATDGTPQTKHTDPSQETKEAGNGAGGGIGAGNPAPSVGVLANPLLMGLPVPGAAPVQPGGGGGAAQPSNGGASPALPGLGSLAGLGGGSGASGSQGGGSPSVGGSPSGAASPSGSGGAKPATASGGGSAAPAADAGGGGGQTNTPAPTVLQNYAQTPLPFEPNVGQTSSQVNFLSRGPGYGVFLAGGGATLAFPRSSDPTTEDVLGLTFPGGAGSPAIYASNQLPSSSNYFLGGPDQWHADVPNYADVTYKDVFPGVDVQFHGSAGHQLEFDFVVAPGADPSTIRLSFQGAQSQSLDGQGNLVLQTGGGPVVLAAPTVYQAGTGSAVQAVTAQAVLQNGLVSYQLGAYDATRPLVIDPSLLYNTLLGGSGDDKAYGVAVDGAGDAYLTGSTASTNFPTTTGVVRTASGGSTDAFVTKLNAQGNAAVWSTYLGGSSMDQGNAIAVGPNDNVYVTGSTTSSNFPTAGGAYQTSLSGTNDAFATELSAAGDALVYSTYLGGSFTASGNAIAVDPGGYAYLTGSAGSGFPTTAGAFQTAPGGGGSTDAFVTRLTPTGGLAYSSYLGGGNSDQGNGIALDSAGDAFVTGSTSSTNFPTTAGAYQGTRTNPAGEAFVTEVKAGGAALAYSTYLGGGGGLGGADAGYAVAVDGSGDAYVTGAAGSTNFPTTAGAYQGTSGGGGDAFVTKLNATGSALVYSTYLGGSSSDQGNGIALDGQGEAFVTGRTQSSNFPTTTGAFQGSLGGFGTYDAFVTKLTAVGSLAYSSYLGGSGDDEGTAVAVDLTGNAYAAGLTNSSNFPLVTATLVSTTVSMSGYNAFVAKVAVLPAAPVLTTITTDTGASNHDQITTYQNLTFNGTAPASATVTLYQAGLGLIGTTAAAANGLFTFNYTGTTLAEGTYDFTGTATLGPLTSAPSADFLVVVDRTPPAVTLTAPAQTTSLGPQVRITASDRNGLPNTTTFALDLNSTANYATGTLTNGTALVTLPALPAAGTYTLDARVLDLAGNQGTSPTATVTVNAATSGWAVTAQVLSADPRQGDALDQLGDVQVSHALDLDQSPGTSQGGDPALVYNSDSVQLHPVVQLTVPTPNNAALPSSLAGTLVWDYGGTTPVTTPFLVSTAGASPGATLTLAVENMNVATTTGRHVWQVQLGTPAGTSTTLGYAFVVNEESSPFGAGWTFSNTDQLVTVAADAYGDPAGVLRVYGTGEWRFYPGTTSFSSPAGDNGTLSLSGGTYTYSTPDGQTETFNSSGDETQWASADGQETLQYRYNGGNQLTGMTAIDGALSTFSYSGGLLSTISTVNGRTTSFAYSGTDLTQITNPDGGVHTFAYVSNHRLTGETFANLQNEYAYTDDRAAQETWGSATGPGGQTNGSISHLSPAAVQGLSTAVAGTVYAQATDPDGYTTLSQRDAQGRLLQQVAANGGVTQDAYGNGFLTSTTDALGRTTSYALDASDYVTQVTNPDGTVASYQYQSAFHALTQSTDERGATTTYAYDGSGHLTSQTDALGDVTSYAYSAGGLMTQQTDPLGNVTSFAYDSLRRLTVTIDPLGDRTTFTYDSNGNPQTTKDARGNVSTTTYDVMGRLVGTTDPLGDASAWTYNAAGLELTTTDPDGLATSAVYDGFNRGLVAQSIDGVGTALQQSVLSGFDNAGQEVASRDADGWWSQTAYDPLGEVTLTADALGRISLSRYDLAGQQTATRDALGAWATTAYNLMGEATRTVDALGDVSTTLYDATGNETAVTDALGRTTSTAYDLLGRQTTTTDPLGHVVTTSYDRGGNVTRVTDADGNVTSYAYDADGQQTSETDAVGTSAQRTLATAYDAVGNQTSQTDGRGNTTTSLYDQANRLTATTDALNHTTTYLLDRAGNTTATIDPLNKTTSYILDALERQVATVDPLGNTTTSVLDANGNQVASIDALGNASESVYDALGRQVAGIDANGNRTQYQYDAVGNQLSLTDPDGNVTQSRFDALGREVVRTDPLNNVTTMSYDAVGETTSVVDRDGRTVTYAYDPAGRQTGATWLSAGGATVNVQTFTYDNNSNQLTAADTNGTVTMGYDALGEVTSETGVYGQTVSYAYDASGNVTQRADSLGGVQTSVYDNANRLTSRELGGSGVTPVRVDLSYTNRDELSSITRYSDLAGTTVVGTTVYSNDAASRVTAITNFNASSATLSYYNQSYNAADQVTSATHWSQVGTVTYSGTVSYSYDKAGQLLGDGTHAYTYDANGNRTMAGYQTGTGNELQSDGTYTYTYDKEGNLTEKSKGAGLQTWYYSYDNLNQLVSVQETSNGTTVIFQATYVYDARGSRVQQTEWATGGSTTVTRFASDGANVYADLDGSNNVLARYVSGDGADQVLARSIPTGQPNAGVAFYLTDPLGSVRDLQDTTGALRDHLDYDPYGNVTESNTSFGDRYEYAGGQADRTTGLVKFGERYYNTATGTWTSQDPLGLGPDPDPYRYVGNDPTNYADPSGEAERLREPDDTKRPRVYPPTKKGVLPSKPPPKYKEPAPPPPVRIPWPNLPVRMPADGKHADWPDIKRRNARIFSPEVRNRWVSMLVETRPGWNAAEKAYVKKALLEYVNAADFYWPYMTGFFGYCYDWADEYKKRVRPLEVKYRDNGYFTVDQQVWYNAWFHDTRIPFLNEAGHTAMRFRLNDGSTFYLDDGNYGSYAHLFLPRSIPTYYNPSFNPPPFPKMPHAAD